jgi:rare lipoprotein A
MPDIQGHVTDGKFLPDPVMKQYPVTPTGIYVQAGSFADQTNAVRLAESLHSIAPSKIVPTFVNGRQFYRVRLGPVPSVAAADSLLATLASTGHKESLIVVE